MRTRGALASCMLILLATGSAAAAGAGEDDENSADSAGPGPSAIVRRPFTAVPTITETQYAGNTPRRGIRKYLHDRGIAAQDFPRYAPSTAGGKPWVMHELMSMD